MPEFWNSTERWSARRAAGGVLVGVVAGAALGFGLACTWRLWFGLLDRWTAQNPHDAILHLWWLGHTPASIVRGGNPFTGPFVSRDLNWPEGVSAMVNTSVLLPGLVLAPLTWLAGPLASLNLLTVLAVPACAAGGYWALRRLPMAEWRAYGRPADGRHADGRHADGRPADGRRADGEDSAGAEPRPGAEATVTSSSRRTVIGRPPLEGSGRPPLEGVGRAAALVGATAFAISPAVVNSLNGHISMAFAPALPVLIVLSGRAWHGERPGRTGLALGLVAAAQLLTGEEVLFQAGLGAGLVLLVCAGSRPKAIAAALPRLAKAIAAALAAFLPIAAYPLYLQFFGPHKAGGNPFLPDFFGADLTSFTTPTSGLLLHTAAQARASARFPGGIEEHLAYLGWPLLIVCLATALLGWRRLPVRCAAVLMVTAMLLSLGGRLWISGVWTEHRGPYHLLQRLPVGEAALATRFGLLAALAAAALLAFAVHDLTTPSPAPQPESPAARLGTALFAAGLTLACLLPLLPAPIPVAAAPAVPGYFASQFKDAPGGRDTPVVLLLPFPNGVDPVAMRWQAAAGYRFRMPGGYFIGPAGNGRAYLGGSVDPLTAQLLQRVARTGCAVLPTAEQQARAVRDLTAWGVTQVVLGPDPAQPALLTTVSALLRRDPQIVDGAAVWQFSPGS